MGKLLYKNVDEVNAKDPCEGFANIIAINNIPPNYQGTVLSCTYLGQTTIQQLIWLIVYMEDVAAIEIVGDIYEAAFSTYKSFNTILNEPVETIFITDSDEDKFKKNLYNRLKTLNNFQYPRTEENNQQLLEYIRLLIEHISVVQSKHFKEVMRAGLIKYDSKP